MQIEPASGPFASGHDPSSTVVRVVGETDKLCSATSPRQAANRLAVFAVLTPSEQSVLAELMEGRTADTIAKKVEVAESTVRSQMKSIRQKLGVNSHLAAAALARQAAWTHGATRPLDVEVQLQVVPNEPDGNESNGLSPGAGP
jgi:DNA-binding CsgD family transcriptional regulator